jgi:hypothetical protein
LALGRRLDSEGQDLSRAFLKRGMHPLAFALFQRYSDVKPGQGRWKMMNQLRGFIDVLGVDGRIIDIQDRQGVSQLH